MSGYHDGYVLDIVACHGVPGVGRYPSQDKPLRAFGYDSSWEFWMADFVLVDGQAVVVDLDLWPAQGWREQLMPVLMPMALDTGDSHPFRRVWMSRTPSSGPAQLTLWVPEDATQAELEVYDRLASALPVTINKEYETWWEAKGLTFAVMPDGSLEVVRCK
jgi:hypothetical protein